jgi:hypothetical protein
MNELRYHYIRVHAVVPETRWWLFWRAYRTVRNWTIYDTTIDEAKAAVGHDLMDVPDGTKVQFWLSTGDRFVIVAGGAW